MSDNNNFTADTGDSNSEANKTSDDGYDCIDGTESAVQPGNNGPTSHDDAAMMAFIDKLHNEDKNKNHSMGTIDEEKPCEFDPHREAEMMVMIDEYTAMDVDHGNNDDIINDDDIVSVSYPNEERTSNNARREDNGSKKTKDGDGKTTASLTVQEDNNSSYPSYEHRSLRNINLRIDTSLGRETDPSWFGAVKAAATNGSIPASSNGSNDTVGRHEEDTELETELEEEGQKCSKQQQQDQKDQLESSESTEMMEDISTKLDDRLNNARLLAKRLLQEMTIYVQSLETIGSEYRTILESEVRESQRLDSVEPEVNGASGMLRAGSGNGGDAFFDDSDKGSQQPSPPSVGLGQRYAGHSSPKEQVRRLKRPGRDRPLTPIVGNRRRNDDGRDGCTGKENYDLLPHSFA